MNDFSKLLNQYVKEYTDDVREGMENAAKKNAKIAVQMLRKNSPKDTGDYAKSWHTVKRGNGYVVKNHEYRLTHLLERGHLKSDGVDSVGPQVHIKPVETQVVKKYMNDVIEVISK